MARKKPAVIPPKPDWQVGDFVFDYKTVGLTSHMCVVVGVKYTSTNRLNYYVRRLCDGESHTTYKNRLEDGHCGAYPSCEKCGWALMEANVA